MLKLVRVIMFKEFLPQVINDYDKPIQQGEKINRNWNAKQSPRQNIICAQQTFRCQDHQKSRARTCQACWASDILSKIHEIKSFLAGRS